MPDLVYTYFPKNIFQYEEDYKPVLEILAGYAPVKPNKDKSSSTMKDRDLLENCLEFIGKDLKPDNKPATVTIEEAIAYFLINFGTFLKKKQVDLLQEAALLLCIFRHSLLTHAPAFLGKRAALPPLPTPPSSTHPTATQVEPVLAPLPVQVPVLTDPTLQDPHFVFAPSPPQDPPPTPDSIPRFLNRFLSEFALGSLKRLKKGPMMYIGKSVDRVYNMIYLLRLFNNYLYAMGWIGVRLDINTEK